MESEAGFLFEFDDANEASCKCVTGAHSRSAALEALAQNVELAARQTTELARQLYRDARMILENLRTSPKSSGALFSLASALAHLGYDVIVRNALGGGNNEYFRALRHEFVVVRGTGNFSGMEFIVEPSLRQHFAIPHCSPDYDYVLSRTPDVFVGGSCRLVPVVQLLCAFMADSFMRQGLPLPPWRQEAAMLSKWLPHPARIRDLVPRRSVDMTAQDMSYMLGKQQQSRSDGYSNSPGAAVLEVSYKSKVDAAGSSSIINGKEAAADPLAFQPPQPVCGSVDLLSSSNAMSWAVNSSTDCGSYSSGHALSSQVAVVVGFTVCSSSLASAATCDANHDQELRDRELSVDTRSSGSFRSSSGLGNGYSVIPLTYTEEMGEAADECVSPSLYGGGLSADGGTANLVSDSSGKNSPVNMDNTLSSMVFPVAGAGAASCFRRGGGRRPTATGMLPDSCATTSLLSAKLIFQPLAAGVAATMAKVAEDERRAANITPLRTHAPSSLKMWLSGGNICRVEIKPPALPNAPSIPVDRLGNGDSGTKGRSGGRHGEADRFRSALEPLSEQTGKLTSWLPWGLAPQQRTGCQIACGSDRGSLEEPVVAGEAVALKNHSSAH